jgi:transcription elongation GreA/GreB family factor
MDQKQFKKRQSMPSQMIYITEQDMKKLRTLIAGVQAGGTKTTLENLEKELDRANVVSPQKIPKDDITMNSTDRKLFSRGLRRPNFL